VPTRIGADICTAPDFNLTDCDIENFMDEMTAYVEKFESAFRRVEQLEWGVTIQHKEWLRYEVCATGSTPARYQDGDTLLF